MQEAVLSSESQAVDTLQSADTLQAIDPQQADTVVRDTAQVIGAIGEQLNESVSQAGRLLVEGQWGVILRELEEGMISLVAGFFPRLISAIVVFLVLYIPYRLIQSLLDKLLQRSKHVDAGLRSLINKTFKVAALSLISVIVMAEFGINVTALLAGLSIAGIAVGFAAKDTLENFISGVTIMIDRPFRIGDFVIVDDTYGEVEEITLRSTRIRTRNNEIMVMPNVQMVNQKLLNHSLRYTLRVDVPFGIAYKEFPQQAREVVLRTVEGDDRIVSNPAPRVVVTAMNSSSVDLQLWLYIHNPADRNAVLWDYSEKVREALREADIEIPFPHLQLFVDEAKAFKGSFLMQSGFPALPQGAPEDTPEEDA